MIVSAPAALPEVILNAGREALAHNASKSTGNSCTTSAESISMSPGRSPPRPWRPASSLDICALALHALDAIVRQQAALRRLISCPEIEATAGANQVTKEPGCEAGPECTDRLMPDRTRRR